MTRRLILMRHAKSGWNDPKLSDHQRILNARGRSACDIVGPWLAAQDYVPDEVLCSTAARTVETWERLSAHLPTTPPVTLSQDLYHAAPGSMLESLRRARGACVAMVAHNPGIGVLAETLVREPPVHEGFYRYPTLATLVVDFDIPDWREASAGAGQTVDFIVPRDLE